MKTDPGVYKVEHVESGRLYIGSTCNLKKRWQAHLRELRAGRHHSPKLQRAWTKHGEDAFHFEPLERVAIVVLKEAEQRWIDILKPCFNVSPFANRPPGRSGPHSEVTKAKIRAKRAEQVITPEAVEKQRSKCLGQVRTPEQRARIAAGCLGRQLSAETKAKIAAARTGTTAGEETRARMSAASLGRKHSDEVRAKISAARMGMKLSPESVLKRQATRRANAARRQETKHAGEQT